MDNSDALLPLGENWKLGHKLGPVVVCYTMSPSHLFPFDCGSVMSVKPLCSTPRSQCLWAGPVAGFKQEDVTEVS
jgi:hypothetical protein